MTTTRRSAAIQLAEEDFTTGGLDEESYGNVWTLSPFRHADIVAQEGRLRGNDRDDHGGGSKLSRRSLTGSGGAPDGRFPADDCPDGSFLSTLLRRLRS